ncbi:AP-1-like transcription factor [Diplogelasinospora grovesii]|uniref:AP-1-like transcription factor n=1 Tax=Diplogelasinospora grovesii TaxID=303347 RepID=A0AAN6NBU0_9PEZI|nr:AP-1-like transcription factor [Diplogelasinospora grovesii]
MAASLNAASTGTSISAKNDGLLKASITVKANSPSAASTPASSAASPPANVSTSASSSSTATPPIAIRPSTSSKPPPIRTAAPINKMAMSSVISPTPMSPVNGLTMTSKEWVIPPRPKPGRKPATDTPPTKRKAQNRAAQRAFRERRAARVGELEEQLEEQKEEHERTVQEMQQRISHLEIETQTLQSRCQWLEAQLEKERQGRSWDNTQQLLPARDDGMMSMQMQQGSPMGPLHSGQHLTARGSTASESVSLAGPRPTAQPFSIAQIISPPEETEAGLDLTCGSCPSNGSCPCAEEALRSTDIPMGCGRCSLGGRCECLEESIKASMASDLKRPLPPGSPSSMAPEEKRQRPDVGSVGGMEIDFTAMFSGPRRREEGSVSTIIPPPVTLSQASQPLMASVEPKDPCGFCKDGTYCVCADSMMASTNPASLSMRPAVQQQPMLQHQQQTQTPPPSEHDVGAPTPMEITATGAVKLRRPPQQPPKPAPAARPSGRCGPNGPGTCAQCLSDPKSGLFCRSLAANFNRQQQAGGAGGGCCGNGGPGGCCKGGSAKPSSDAKGSSNKPPGVDLGLSLSCADAYKTLASHRHFEEAADEIGSWLPKLKAVPIPVHPGQSSSSNSYTGRAPIEVEAASIMSVLKGFDVRFGRGQ